MLNCCLMIDKTAKILIHKRNKITSLKTKLNFCLAELMAWAVKYSSNFKLSSKAAYEVYNNYLMVNIIRYSVFDQEFQLPVIMKQLGGVKKVEIFRAITRI